MRHITCIAILIIGLISAVVVFSQKRFQLDGKPVEFDLGMSVSEIAFSNDGRYLAAGGFHNDSSIKVWDTKSWQILYELKLKRDSVRDLIFSPSSRVLALVMDDRYVVEILFIDAATGREIGRYADKPKLNPRISNYIWTIAFSPNEKSLAIGQESGDVRQTVKLLNIEDLKNVFVEKTDIFVSPSRIVSLSFSPNGRYLAFTTIGGPYQENGKIIVLDLNSGKAIMNVKEFGQGYSTIFSPIGRVLATAGMDYNADTKTRETRLVLYDTYTWEKVSNITQCPAGGGKLSFSKDGLLATAGEKDIESEYEVCLLDTKTMKTTKKYNNIFQAQNAIAMSPDGKLVVIGNEKGIIKIFDIDK